ncbi:LacI family DNA-binding transcriptional regulator [Dellaglioa carnosa]|uniref:LacI family DNA-binding transcriptional regulator n=1 Tax=Dellaglioa carnosa TaxID=2995136 RepID=UPI0022A8CEC6|nr:LacI family DNA-binding transcriptional regulator [Dellaglioa carnosa]MCZ2492856.1 LacI family transcriptional regulator [Dellaglioa carnosa]
MKKNITIKDIAKNSETSISTVSRVLNNDPNVAELTRKKIKSVIADMNYTPSMLARGMISKKTNMIAVVVSDITNPYFNQFIAFLEQQFLEKGYTLSLFDTQSANKKDPLKALKIEIDIYNQIQKNNYDAVLILGGLIDKLDLNEQYLNTLKSVANKIPVVIVGRKKTELLKNAFFIPRSQSISINLITNHLIQSDYKIIAFIGGTKTDWITRDRINSFIKVTSDNNIMVDNKSIINNNYYAKNGYEGVAHLIDNDINFDAILAINDQVAQGALRGVRDMLGPNAKKGIASCESFADNKYNIPRITSVNHNIKQLSENTTFVLMNLLNGSESLSEMPDVVPKLILGESL